MALNDSNIICKPNNVIATNTESNNSDLSRTSINNPCTAQIDVKGTSKESEIVGFVITNENDYGETKKHNEIAPGDLSDEKLVPVVPSIEGPDSTKLAVSVNILKSRETLPSQEMNTKSNDLNAIEEVHEKCDSNLNSNIKDDDTGEGKQISNCGGIASNLDDDKLVINDEKPTVDEDIKENLNIYCSTPVVSKAITKNLDTDKQTPNLSTVDFGQMSPLDSLGKKHKSNLKRKNLELECIEEVDENAYDILTEKRLKSDKSCIKTTDVKEDSGPDISSSMPCFEPPAKSLLKKWQPSCLSRNTTSSFIVLDECTETDDDDCTKHNESTSEPIMTDDFEVAYKSLTEELMKSTSNLETLEKYHSQVQMESQIDDEKFDEVLQELTLNYDWEDKTSLTQKTLGENVINEADNFGKDQELNESVSEINTTVVEIKEINGPNEISKEQDNKNGNVPLTEATSSNEGLSGEVKSSIQLSVKSESIRDSLTSSEAGIHSSRPSDKNAENEATNEKSPIVHADEKDMTMDEEDFLLEEDVSSKKKPYEFFEFVSNDPKENEDNYNPEWQKLGRLTSDEERYKAVRDRWRSLVPPDPNRDLTCRQWRQKNNKPPINLTSLNNNHQMDHDSDRNQLCTAVFEMKIKKIVRELEDSRMKILRQRNMDFENLGKQQDNEQRMLSRRGANVLELSLLHKHHIEECRELKNVHDEKLKRITGITEEKIRILKDASEEVLLFQKFYKGVGDDEICLYMTDVQVQELMETEEMLEQYTKFYQ